MQRMNLGKVFERVSSLNTNTRFKSLSSLLLLVACGTSPVSGTTADAGKAEAAAIDLACDAPSVSFARAAATLPKAFDHHHTFVREVGGAPYLYVLGGEQDDFAVILDEVLRAPIAADGSLGAFEVVGRIPRGRAGGALAVVGDDVVIAGGAVGVPRVTFTNEVLVSRFTADGKLETWNVGPQTQLPQPIMHAAAVLVGRDVYVFGGTTGRSASTTSVKITINADGTLSPVTAMTPLNPPRSHQTAFFANNAVYQVGGLDAAPQGNPPGRNDVIRARRAPDGSLGDWEEAGTLETPLSISAVVQVGCSFLFPGGLDDTSKSGPYSDRILRGSLTADGSFRTESTLESKLSVKRGHVHQVPMYKQFLYSVGGRSNTGATIDTIDIGVIK
jgi:hypothetical protein